METKIHASLFFSLQQTQSSQSTLERSSNSQSKGNTPQPNAILPNPTTTNTTSPKTMTSIELDTVRGGSEQPIEHISQPQSRDVTRVVKILKQNEPLVRQRFSTRYYLNILKKC